MNYPLRKHNGLLLSNPKPIDFSGYNMTAATGDSSLNSYTVPSSRVAIIDAIHVMVGLVSATTVDYLGMAIERITPQRGSAFIINYFEDIGFGNAPHIVAMAPHILLHSKETLVATASASGTGMTWMHNHALTITEYDVLEVKE